MQQQHAHEVQLDEAVPHPNPSPHIKTTHNKHPQQYSSSTSSTTSSTHMKYISMKMEPKGSRPPTAAITGGRRYHFLSGMGEGMRFTLQRCRRSRRVV